MMVYAEDNMVYAGEESAHAQPAAVYANMVSVLPRWSCEFFWTCEKAPLVPLVRAIRHPVRLRCIVCVGHHIYYSLRSII